MNKFLKPTLIKIILTVFLLCLSFFARLYLSFPLNSVYYPPFQCPEGALCNSPAPRLNLLIFIFNLVFNLIFFYLIACFLVWIWQKIKQFLKKDWRKIVLFILLFIISAFYKVGYHLSPVEFGRPFVFCYVYPVVELTPEIHFNFLGLFGDIIVWYFISCIIIWFYDKLKKKPQ